MLNANALPTVPHTLSPTLNQFYSFIDWLELFGLLADNVLQFCPSQELHVSPFETLKGSSTHQFSIPTVCRFTIFNNLFFRIRSSLQRVGCFGKRWNRRQLERPRSSCHQVVAITLQSIKEKFGARVNKQEAGTTVVLNEKDVQ